MGVVRGSQVVRRDNIFTDDPFLLKTVVIQCIFTAAFLVTAGLCTRVLLKCRGCRFVYALVLTSTIFYVIDLAMDIAENTVTPTEGTAPAMLHLVQAEAFFGAMAFPVLFAAVALAAIRRHAFVSEVSGRNIRLIFDSVVVLGGLFVAWQSIVSLVYAGMEISFYGFEFDRVLDGPAFFSFVKQIHRINTVGYARSASLCVGCLYAVFVIVYTYIKMTRIQHFRDDVTKLMMLLVVPTCALNFLYVLIFTVLLTPQISREVFLTDASAEAIDLADTAISPGIPLLIASALVAIGLKHSVWRHASTTASTEGFVPMHDWPVASGPPGYSDSAEPPTGKNLKESDSHLNGFA